MYWLGYLVLALGVVALTSAITTGRPGAAALTVGCLYLAFSAWRMNADEVRRAARHVRQDADGTATMETQPATTTSNAAAPLAATAERQPVTPAAAALGEPEQPKDSGRQR
jgi:hypothetical protein